MKAIRDAEAVEAELVVPPITTPIPDRSRIAPFRIDSRTLRAWMRGADIKAPKWKNSSVRFYERGHPPSPFAFFSVPQASVARARARADAAAAKPRPIKPTPTTWKRSDIEAVDYGTTISMLMDGLFDETGVATLRRAYSAEEEAMLARWHRGLFSQIKYDAGPFMIRWTGKGGLIIEERPNPVHQRRQIRRYHDRAATDWDLNGAFSLMLWWATKINRLIKNRCNAKTPTGRAYQAAAAIRDYHRLRMGIGEADIIAADIVIEDIGEHLRRSGRRIDWWQRTVTLDLLEGASSYEAADRFGRDASSLRERYDAETLAIEAKFGRYCNDLWEPPQKPIRPCYNIYRKTGSAKPWLAEVQLTPSERAALVQQYVGKANSPFLKWGYGDPLTWIRWRAGIRYGYKLIAGYLENGGRILTGYAPPADLPEEWFVDRRSDARILDDALGSFFRQPGLDPFDGRLTSPRIVNDEARMMRVFQSAILDVLKEDIAGS
jgi:hypothetical protein